MKLTPINDDIWIWAMAVLNGTKIRIPAAAQSKLIYVDIDTELNGETLASKNIGGGKNDLQLRQMIEHYPALLERLIRETVDSEPYISIVVPVKNSANVPACIDNIFWQKFPDFELIVVNCGARVNLPPLPTNFSVINYPGGSLVDALNLGLRKAAGDYVLFLDENSILPNDALNVVAQMADSSKADVIHFAGHVQIIGNNGNLVLDDAPELRRDQPILFDAAKQIRAAMFLQNKLSRRLDTKIFRRDFLTEHGLTFGDDPAEFLFSALLEADKYLIVPQAFSYRKE
ncbi:MAG: glycosyltransferase [Selenomonadaceae bacterium]|nr:glycosyltransferase [Selenomonadaceae bacterium]